jgi:hypothetical protein
MGTLAPGPPKLGWNGQPPGSMHRLLTTLTMPRSTCSLQRMAFCPGIAKFLCFGHPAFVHRGCAMSTIPGRMCSLHLEGFPPLGPYDDCLGHPGSLHFLLPFAIIAMLSLTDSWGPIVRKLNATLDIVLQSGPRILDEVQTRDRLATSDSDS